MNILYAIMIYCLPSMALTAWYLFRLELKMEDGERTPAVAASCDVANLPAATLPTDILVGRTAAG